MTDSTLYDEDIVLWAEAQVSALKELAGRRDLPNALDLANVIEEIDSVGRSQIEAVESLVTNILTHLIKLAGQPDAVRLDHWRDEIVTWRTTVDIKFANSMRQRLDIELAWRRATRAARKSLELHRAALPTGLPARCPLTLDEILDVEADDLALVERIRPSHLT